MIDTEWQEIKIKYVARICNGKEIANEVDADTKGAIDVYGSGGVFKHTDRYLYNGEAVLFGRKGTIGKPMYVEGKFWTVDTMFYVDCNKVNTKLLYYIFKVFPWNLYTKTTTLPSVVGTDIANSKIVIPKEMGVQETIKDFLDINVPKIEKVIDTLMNEIVILEATKLSLITECVSRGINPQNNFISTKNKLIKEIPMGWKCIKVKYVAKFYNGDRSEKYPKDYEIVEEGVPFLNSENIHGEVVDTSLKCKYITNEKYSELGGAKLQIDDIIFCLRGSIGLCAINKTEEKGTIASSLVAIRANNSILPDFLNYYLSSEIVKTQTIQCMNGSCAANLSADDVKNYFISMPDGLKEQQEIVDYLNKKCGAIDRIIETKRKQIEKLETHKLSMIYDYVTGIKRVGGTA